MYYLGEWVENLQLHGFNREEGVPSIIISGAPQLRTPCRVTGAYCSWKELGMINHLPGLSRAGPVARDPICPIST